MTALLRSSPVQMPSTFKSPAEYNVEKVHLIHGASILFILDESSNAPQAAKQIVEHVCENPADQVAMVILVRSESERELTLRDTTAWLQGVHMCLPVNGKFLIHVLVEPEAARFEARVGDLVKEMQANLVVLGSRASSRLGSIASSCCSGAGCRVIVHAF
ncbi:hypothetical protein BC830DRAFT_1097261 [Chytriomyces sp. MP71]|nr:hypothetical protein BC830DRAFT_1097261 [Chytriomyces sp. MP71]